jgi:hypothetical protein
MKCDTSSQYQSQYFPKQKENLTIAYYHIPSPSQLNTSHTPIPQHLNNGHALETPSRRSILLAPIIPIS